MEGQKIINHINNKNDQPCKFRAKNWIVVTDDANKNYNVGNSNKFQTTIFKSSLCNYNGACILVKETIIDGEGQRPDKRHKKVILKNCVSSASFIIQVNKT